MYQNAHMNENFSMYIHSLVLEIEGLFYISFDLLNTFQSRSIRSKKEKKFSNKKKLPTYLVPYFFQDVT